MTDYYPINSNVMLENLSLNDREASSPPEALVRDAAFLKTELIPPQDKFIPEYHLHQTGQSLVYAGIERETGERFVFKINYREIQTTFDLIGSTGVSLEEAQTALQPERLARCQDFNDRLKFLRAHFGEAVPDELWEVKIVAMSGATLQYILGEDSEAVVQNIDPGKIYELETFIRSQAYDSVFEDPNRVTTATRYAEIIWYNKAPENTMPFDLNDYLAVTEILTQPGVESMTLDTSGDILNTLIKVQDSVWLERMLIEVVRNPKLAISVRDFLTKLDKYHIATGGAPIDAIGIDNIIFDCEGNCHMGDSLETEKGPTLAIGHTILVDIAEGRLPTREQVEIVLNVLNYVRGINAIAIASDSPIRVILPLPTGTDNKLTIERVLALLEIYETENRIPKESNTPDVWDGALDDLRQS